uniref:Immunoglobulin V-set domain-containing protein n=1 Tax=Moschus moschiferus TaxID=68415 RepID=A0A8C6D9P3_MOSMO
KILFHLPVLSNIGVSEGAGAQSVTQPDSHITVSGGARLELRCNSSSPVSPYLFWYVQYPKQGLQLLLKCISGDSLVSGIKGFKAEFKETTSFHLEKASAKESDSAVYYLSDLMIHFGLGTRK